MPANSTFWNSEKPHLQLNSGHKKHSYMKLATGEQINVDVDSPTEDEQIPDPEVDKPPTITRLDRKKTLFAFLLLVISLFVNSCSIALTHQKVPDRNLHPPLPDLVLDNLTKNRVLNDVADVLVVISVWSSVFMILFHQYRWLLARRAFVMLSILYLIRSLTMYLTVLPLANTHVVCDPKLNSTDSIELFKTVVKEAAKTLASGGLGISGKKMCGDYIYSGHTIILVMAYLLFNEYTNRKLLHWLFYTSAISGMIFLLVSHGHYSIDVFIAYFVTTRLFWTYHTLIQYHSSAHANKRRSECYFSQVWWSPFFQYFEGRTRQPIVNKFSIPWKNSYNTPFVQNNGFV